MEVHKTEIDGVFTITPHKHGDDRGFLSEVFKRDVLESHGVMNAWDQDNHSYSSERGVVRGLHFQSPPHAQAKLIRVVRGAIYDVAVDIRKSSSTYGRHVGRVLSASNWTQLYMPAGFAHGFCTLEESTEVLYKVSGRYDPKSEGGLLWSDPDLTIDWPIGLSGAIVNARDMAWPTLKHLTSPF